MMLDRNFPLYVTSFILAFAITGVTEHYLIPKLKKVAGQPIYSEGPRWHVSKSGTPTMGGIAFLIAIITVLVFSCIFLYAIGEYSGALSLMLCICFSLLNSAVGIIDDLKKLKHKHNEGLKPREKLLLQSITCILFLLARFFLLGEQGSISFSFGDIDLGLIYYPISFIILLGIINCANLTDGIDGLAAGVAFAIGVSFFYISCALSYEVCFISSALMGASTAFLIFNLHPAKIFMGDTGSLFLGALTASCAIALGNPLTIIFIGAVYVIEGISVILQVITFKLTHKRIFKMSPIHHHFEKCGWSENRICIVAIIITFIASIPAFLFYLP